MVWLTEKTGVSVGKPSKDFEGFVVREVGWERVAQEMLLR
jgi:hypothetical protein